MSLSAVVFCGLLFAPAPTAAQDSWMLFQKDERTRRGGAAPPDGTGIREGDRPLEPRGGRDAPPSLRRDGPRGNEWPPAGPPRGAAPVAVERQELAPLLTPEPDPPSAASMTPPPASGWDTRTAPAVRDLPPPRRESGLAPAPRSLADPPALRAPAPQPPPSRGPLRPALESLANLPPKTLEDITHGLALPSRSPAIASLWPEPWRANGGPVSPAFEAARIEALRRAGAVEALQAVLSRQPVPTEPALAMRVLRAHLLVGNREAGCALAGEAIRNRTSLSADLRREAVLAAGYCALAGGNADAGKLTADIIRGENIDAPFARAVLEGAGADGKAAPPLPATVGVLDYRIGETARLVWPSTLVERADPAVLVVIATGETTDPGLRIAAAERAGQLALIAPDFLARQYRDLPASPEDLAHPLATRQTGAMRRAVLMQAAEFERAPDKKARLLRALMEDAREAGLRGAVARMLGPLVGTLRATPDLAWFADDAAEILVRSGRGESVEMWAGLNRDLDHWRVLGALASETGVPPGNALASLERIARSGRLEATWLHRLVTVLDALDVQVPIPLWEVASSTPQPTDGHLPATGVLAELKSASDKREGARTILRAAEAMGPASAADANLLTLGDVIRALKSTGFQREARALGIEALIDSWPTGAGR